MSFVFFSHLLAF